MIVSFLVFFCHSLGRDHVAILKPVIPDERRAAKRDPESRKWNRIEDFWIPARAPIQALRLKVLFSRKAGLAGMTSYDAVSGAGMTSLE